MNKRSVSIILCISILLNIFQFAQPMFKKNSKQQEETTPVINSMDNEEESIFMNNSIDQYFVKQFSHTKSEMEYEIMELVYENSKDALLAVMLDNFSIKPGTPEKNSWGLGTSEQLELCKGMFLRNQCVVFIPYLQGEYCYPTEKELGDSIHEMIESMS